MPITVGVLGALSVSGQGGTVDLPGRRQRSLIAILALEGGRIVSAAHLIDLLWSDTEPADPLNALQHQISRLRAAIGRDAVVRDEVGYGLDVTPDRVDALRFEQLATLGRDQLANGATADARAALGPCRQATTPTRTSPLGWRFQTERRPCSVRKASFGHAAIARSTSGSRSRSMGLPSMIGYPQSSRWMSSGKSSAQIP